MISVAREKKENGDKIIHLDQNALRKMHAHVSKPRLG
jgi:hypothetical protein